MGYLVKWTDTTDGATMIVGLEFETPAQAADFISQESLKDFNNGLSGIYSYTIIEGSLGKSCCSNECPVPGGFVDCPHCNLNGFCTLDNPKEECDDYYYYAGGDGEE